MKKKTNIQLELINDLIRLKIIKLKLVLIEIKNNPSLGERNNTNKI